MIATCFTSVVLALPAQAAAQAAAPAPEPALDVQPAPDEEGWSFGAFIYYWSASIDGDLTVDGDEIEIDGGDDEGTSSDPALYGFLGQFEASRGPWSVVFAPIFVTVATTGDESAGASADVEIDAQVHELFVTHDLAGGWDWLAGARYYELETEVQLSVGGVPTGAPDSIQSWVDPIVGVRGRGQFSDDWSWDLRGDIGGFGLGSEFAWNASALVGYHFSSSVGAHLGYRALSVNFNDSSGADRAEFDLTMYGPVIGISFSF